MAQKEPKILIDACASRALVEHLLHHRGIDAIRSDDVLPQKASDDQVLEFARGAGRVILTINGEDFRQLAKNNPGHPGLIIMESVNLPRQLELGELIVDRILEDMNVGRPPNGHVYEISGAGKIRRYKLP